jgi:hypothetical protein
VDKEVIGPMASITNPGGPRRLAPFACATLVLLVPATAWAATRNVDNANPACSDATGAPFCTVAAAVAATAAGDVIEVAAGDYIESIVIDHDLTIRGAGASTVAGTCDGQTDLLGAPTLSVNADVTASVTGVTIKGGPVDLGGGVVNAGHLTLSDSDVCQAATFQKGAGLYTSGRLDLVGVRVYDNLQVAAGAEGGGLYVAAGGVAVVSKSAFTGNRVTRGGGIAVAAGGALFLADSSVEGNFADSTLPSGVAGAGGGIYNAGLAVIDRTRIGGRFAAGNVVINPNGLGGGIYNEGGLLLTRSSVVGNVVDDYEAGAPAGIAFGAGLYNGGIASLASTTVSGNLFQPLLLSYGAGIASSGTLSLSNVTITDNANGAAGITGGAGVFVVAGTATVRNSIIASQAAGTDCDGAMVTDGSNIDTDNTCGLVSVAAGGTDQPAVADAGLLPLEDNGGPSLSHDLAEGSPAIDAGAPAGCMADPNGVGVASVPLVTDQRGNVFVEVAGLGGDPSGCDAGAVEFNLLSNAMMEDDDDGDRIADGWTGTDLLAGDRLLCQPALAHEGRCSFRLVGRPNRTKQIAQALDRAGVAGDAYTLRIFAAGLAVTGSPRVRVQLDDLQTIGIDEEFTLPLATGTYDYTEHTLEITSAIAGLNGYDRVTTIVEAGSGGTLAVDDVSLVPHP